GDFRHRDSSPAGYPTGFRRPPILADSAGAGRTFSLRRAGEASSPAPHQQGAQAEAAERRERCDQEQPAGLVVELRREGVLIPRPAEDPSKQRADRPRKLFPPDAGGVVEAERIVREALEDLAEN